LTILEITGLTKSFGGLTAVSNIDIKVEDGDILGFIGPNGAGKTTFFNLITGVIRPTKGKVVYKGKDITGKKSHEIAELGIGRTFQLNPLFPNFTVAAKRVIVIPAPAAFKFSGHFFQFPGLP
jgi:branched-chain amino acid transport system ATP-binding protein